MSTTNPLATLREGHACRRNAAGPAIARGSEPTTAGEVPGRSCADFGSPSCCARQTPGDQRWQPDLRRMREDVATLVGFKTRNTLAPNHSEVAAWLAGRLAETGLAVRRLPYAIEPGNGQPSLQAFNLEGRKAGEQRHRVGDILLTAHFDSINHRDPGVDRPAPGANDNASGVAALLEIARLLAPLPTGRSIRVVLLSGEEQESVGAAAYANQLVAERASVRWLANLDMIGTSGVRPVIRVGIDRVSGPSGGQGGPADPHEQRQARASLAVGQRFVRTALGSSDIRRLHIGTMEPTDGDSFTRFWWTHTRILVVFDLDSGGDPLIHTPGDRVVRESPADAAWDDCNWWRITRLLALFVRDEAERRRKPVRFPAAHRSTE